MSRDFATLVAVGFLIGCGGPPAPRFEVCRAESLRACVLPQWYEEAAPSRDDLVFVGRGCADRDDAASLQAKSEVAAQIEERIETTTGWIDRVTENGKVDRHFARSGKATVTQLLRGGRITRRERVCDGRYVAARYELDLRPVELVVAERLRARWSDPKPSRIEWRGPSLLLTSEFVRALDRYLVAGGSPGVVRAVDLALRREAGQWIVVVDDVSERLGPHDLSRMMRWHVDASGLTLTLQSLGPPRGPNRLEEGDRFVLQLDGATPGGHFAVFDLVPDGRVHLMQDSRPLAERQTIPPVSERHAAGGVFDARLSTPGLSVEDVFLVVSARVPLDTSSIRGLRLEGGVPQTEDAYALDRFVEWFDARRGDGAVGSITTLHVRIEPTGMTSAADGAFGAVDDGRR